MLQRLLLVSLFLASASTALGQEHAQARDPAVPLWVRPAFTPYTSAPHLKNQKEIAAVFTQALGSRNSGIIIIAGEDTLLVGQGGPILTSGEAQRVRVWVFITEGGQIGNSIISDWSGNQTIDLGSLRIVRRMVFAPAVNRAQVVPVWVMVQVEVGRNGSQDSSL